MNNTKNDHAVSCPTRTPGYTRHIITKSSTDGTFEKGDHIVFNDDGSISCIEAMGWIAAEDVKFATEGMKSEPDDEWVKKKKARLIAELSALCA